MRSNDTFNFPMGWIQYTVIVVLISFSSAAVLTAE